MRYHLFQKFFGKMVKIKETSFLSTREDTNFLPPLYALAIQPRGLWLCQAPSLVLEPASIGGWPLFE